MRKSSIFRLASTLLVAALLWAVSDSVSLAAKQPVLVSGTAWDTTGTINFQPGKGPGTSTLEFGVADELGAGDFLLPILDEFAESFTMKGTYVQDLVKGKLALSPDPTVVEEEIVRLMRLSLEAMGYNPDDFELSVELKKAAVKAKSSLSKKVGELVKVNAQVKSIVTLSGLGDTFKGKFGFSYKGQGLKHVNNGG